MEKITNFALRVNRSQTFFVSEEDMANLDIQSLGNGEFHIIHDRLSRKIKVNQIHPIDRTIELEMAGRLYHIEITPPLQQMITALGLTEKHTSGMQEVAAPMPGKVLQILVEGGQKVEEGQDLLILEAMKMENVLKADTAGTIKHIHTSEGVAVDKNVLLLTIDATDT